MPLARYFKAALLAALLVATFPFPATAAPERPTDDSVVLYVVPTDRAGAQSELRAAEAALSREPQNLGLAIKSARLAIEQGRRWADPRFYGRAQAALAPWWDQTDPPEEARVLRAVIRQALHDFDGALADVDAIIAASPGNAQARLSRAFIRMVTGDLVGAAEDCSALGPIAGPLPTAICGARVNALTGAAEEGYERLRLALAEAPATAEPMRIFATSVRADIAIALGRNEEADRLLTAASGDGADVPLLVATADHLLDAGRPDEVLSLLDGKGDADALLLRRTIAAARLSDPRLSQWSAILNERFAAGAAAGLRIHLREEARFRLEVEDDPAAALPLAIANWAVQKEPPDARILLECAIAAGDPAAAADVVSFIGETGLVDSRITPLIQRLGEHAS